MTEAITRAGVPAKRSYTAGTYVCNDLLYSLLHRCFETSIRVAFVHIPLEKDLPLSDSVKALSAAIETL
jgi:pyroglutamyl-peptidase